MNLTKEMQMKRNPQRGFHPDMFSKEDTPVFVRLSQMTRDEIEQCIPSDFSAREFEIISEDKELLESVLENNKSFMIHVAASVEAALKDEIEKLKTHKEIEREFIATVKDPYNDITALDDKKSKEFNESWLATALCDPKNWHLNWSEKRYTEVVKTDIIRNKPYERTEQIQHYWDYDLNNKPSPVLEVVFSGSDTTGFERLTDKEKDWIIDEIDLLPNVDNAVLREHKIIVDYNMPGYYVGDVNWQRLENGGVDIKPAKESVLPARIKCEQARYLASCTY